MKFLFEFLLFIELELLLCFKYIGKLRIKNLFINWLADCFSTGLQLKPINLVMATFTFLYRLVY